MLSRRSDQTLERATAPDALRSVTSEDQIHAVAALHWGGLSIALGRAAVEVARPDALVVVGRSSLPDLASVTHPQNCPINPIRTKTAVTGKSAYARGFVISLRSANTGLVRGSVL